MFFFAKQSYLDKKKSSEKSTKIDLISAVAPLSRPNSAKLQRCKDFTNEKKIEKRRVHI